MKDLLELYFELCGKYSPKEALQVPIYIGDDDELNGVHCAFGIDMLDIKEEYNEYLVHMINDTCINNEIKDKAILIS